MKRHAAAPKVAGRTVIKGRKGDIIVTPCTPEQWAQLRGRSAGTAKPKPKTSTAPPLSASQARRLIRDLEYFVSTGELTEAQYKAQRASVVARMTQGERK